MPERYYLGLIVCIRYASYSVVSLEEGSVFVSVKAMRMLALAILGMVILAACGTSSSPPLTASDILKNATTASMKLKSAKFTMDVKVTAAGQSIPATGTGKLTTNPQRSSFSFSINLSGLAIPLDIIQDGNVSYSKDPTTGKWIKTTNTNAANQLNVTNFESLQNFILVGTETVNGFHAYHIKGTDKDGNVQEYWFRIDNFYPAEATIAMAGDTPITGSITFTSWDEDLTIELPAPDQIERG